MQRLGERDEPLDQKLGCRAADDDGERVQHVLDDADGIPQPGGRFATPSLERCVSIALERRDDECVPIGRLADTERFGKRLHGEVALETAGIAAIAGLPPGTAGM